MKSSPARALLACTLALLFGGRMHEGVADPPSLDREHQLRAAYLFNFLKFVEWPASLPLSDVLSVCFAGAEGVRRAMAVNLDEKRVGARRLVLRMLAASDSTDGCSVVYIEGQAQRLPAAEQEAPLPPILTVSDSKDFARHGGVVELFEQDNRLRFCVNVDNARRAGLRISATLLQLATRIEGS